MSEREYRSMEFRILKTEADEPSYKVEGHASTFDRYFLFDIDGVDYFEQIEPEAFRDADMSDVVFRIDHTGPVYARTSAGSIELDIDDKGLHHVTDLARTNRSRAVFDDIEAGNYPQMSFAFTVEEEHFDANTNTRIIDRIKKVYDISPVTFPANPNTDLYARALIDGEIKKAEAERLRREEAERRDSQRREELKNKIMGVIA